MGVSVFWKSIVNGTNMFACQNKKSSSEGIALAPTIGFFYKFSKSFYNLLNAIYCYFICFVFVRIYFIKNLNF